MFSNKEHFRGEMQNAIDRVRYQTGVIEPERIFIDNVPFEREEWTKLRESDFMMENFDMVLWLKRMGLSIVEEVVPREVNGYKVNFIFELTPSSLTHMHCYEAWLDAYFNISLLCEDAKKRTGFSQRHVFDLGGRIFDDGLPDVTFRNYVTNRDKEIIEDMVLSICRAANEHDRKKAEEFYEGLKPVSL